MIIKVRVFCYWRCHIFVEFEQVRGHYITKCSWATVLNLFLDVLGFFYKWGNHLLDQKELIKKRSFGKQL